MFAAVWRNDPSPSPPLSPSPSPPLSPSDSQQGISHAGTEKTMPENVSTLNSFLNEELRVGTFSVQFYSKFLPNSATTTEPRKERSPSERGFPEWTLS